MFAKVLLAMQLYHPSNPWFSKHTKLYDSDFEDPADGGIGLRYIVERMPDKWDYISTQLNLDKNGVPLELFFRCAVWARGYAISAFCLVMGRGERSYSDGRNSSTGPLLLLLPNPAKLQICSRSVSGSGCRQRIA